MDTSPVLVVEYDEDERERLSGLLEQNGFDVVVCPGPKGPDYVCLGGRGLPCPLAHAADVVVLDMRLGGDVMMRGTPGWELLIYYLERGKNVVVLSNGEDPVHPLSDERAIAIRRPPDEDSLIRATTELTRRMRDREGERDGDDPAR